MLAWASRGRPKRGRGQPSSLEPVEIFDLRPSRLWSSTPHRVTGVLPYGLILGQSLGDAFLKEDEVAEVAETSHALEDGAEFAGPGVKWRKIETDVFFRMLFLGINLLT